MIHKDDGNLAALAAYEREQERLEVSRSEVERAKVRCLFAELDGLLPDAFQDQHAKDYAGIIALVSQAIMDRDSLADVEIDDAALGKAVKALIWPYLTEYAERNHEEYL